MSEILKRSYNFEIRANENEGKKIITGRPIVYESKATLGEFDEVILKGALDKADLSDVSFFINHDISKIPLARASEDCKTMRITVDDEGMTMEVEPDVDNNSEARALYSAIKRGDISGMSFMFSVDADEWEGLDSDHPTRKIRAIGKVIEVSAVTFPAYEATEISARDKQALDKAKKTVESARNNCLELEKLKAKYLYKI